MAKVKINKNFKKIFEKALKQSAKKMGKLLLKESLKSVEKGKSPVKGKRFPNYSQAYRDAISDGRYSRYGKKLRPVNLNLSGKMLKSGRVRLTNKGFQIYFTDKKAPWINEGTNKMPARRFIPLKSEDYTKRIYQNLEKILAKNIDKEIKK